MTNTLDEHFEPRLADADSFRRYATPSCPDCESKNVWWVTCGATIGSGFRGLGHWECHKCGSESREVHRDERF